MIDLQIFLSFFWREYKRKKVVKVSKAARRTRGMAIAADVATIDDVIVEGEDLTPDEEEIAAALQEDDSEPEAMLADDGRDAHDEKVVQTLKVRAIADMARKGVKITAAQSKAAIGILPKVGNFRNVQY
jgi:hypothetical protein